MNNALHNVMTSYSQSPHLSPCKLLTTATCCSSLNGLYDTGTCEYGMQEEEEKGLGHSEGAGRQCLEQAQAGQILEGKWVYCWSGFSGLLLVRGLNRISDSSPGAKTIHVGRCQ